MSLFKRGFKALEQEEKRQKDSKGSSSSIFRFFIKEGEAEITFLTEEPINFYEHTVKGFKNGKETYNNIPCKGEGCDYCLQGERASFKSAWLIVDHRPYSYTNQEGQTISGEATVKLLVYGTKTAGVVQRKAQRYGLANKKYLVERIGAGTSTQYTLDNLGESDFNIEEVVEILPKQYKEMFDGSEESLYTIIETEIMKALGETNNSFDSSLSSGDDEDEPKRIGLKRL